MFWARRCHRVHPQITRPGLLGANIVLTFNENVVLGSGNISLYKTNGTLVEAMNVSSSAVTASTNTVTINPTANLVSLEAIIYWSTPLQSQMQAAIHTLV